MNLKKSLGRDRDYVEDELNITPVMNIFLILIPFLMLTAVFVRIAVLEFSLPSAQQAQSAQSEQKEAVVTVISINENGFDLKTQGMKFSFINKQEQNFDFQTLVDNLRRVKERHQLSEDVIIAPHAAVKYDTIIKVMDRCRENGFPNISISG